MIRSISDRRSTDRTTSVFGLAAALVLITVAGCTSNGLGGDECGANTECGTNEVCWSGPNGSYCRDKAGLEACCDASAMCGYVGCADPRGCPDGVCPDVCDAKAAEFASCLATAGNCETDTQDRCKKVISKDGTRHSFCEADNECTAPLTCVDLQESCDSICCDVQAQCNDGGSVGLPLFNGACGVDGTCSGRAQMVATCMINAGPLTFPCDSYANCAQQFDCGCTGKDCGADTCGGVCGTCPTELTCDAAGACALDAVTRYEIVILDAMIDTGPWDQLLEGDPEPDVEVCVELGNGRAGDPVVCSSVKNNTYTPAWNEVTPDAPARKMIEGIGFKMDDVDLASANDEICDFGKYTFSAAEMRGESTITLRCANGSLRVMVRAKR